MSSASARRLRCRRREFAAEIQATLTEEDIASSFAASASSAQGVPLCDMIFPPESGDGTFVGSTDVGTVSWVVPTVQLRGATYAIGTPGHSWQLVAQGKTGRRIRARACRENNGRHGGRSHRRSQLIERQGRPSRASTASPSSILFRTMSSRRFRRGAWKREGVDREPGDPARRSRPRGRRRAATTPSP